MNTTSSPAAAAHAPRRGDRELRFETGREFPVPPALAWRALGDTDHMNRVLRMPSVEFSPPGGPESGFVRRARARLLGRAIAYREHPFEWVSGRGYTVLREFESGPLARLRVGVALEPVEMPPPGDAAGGAGDGALPPRGPAMRGARASTARKAASRPGGSGVRVTACVECVPAGLAGRLLVPLVMPRMVASMLDYCAELLERRRAGAADPLPLPAERSTVERPRLELAIERLARAGVRPRLLDLLRERIERGTDAQVLRVRPFETADAWGEDRLEVLRLFLHATRAGLFELRWELMCPACRVPKGEAETLAELPGRFHCDTCGIDYETDFDQRVELRFSVHPAIRRARDLVYCIGGPLRTPHVVAQQLLAPGEARVVPLELREDLRLRTPGGPALDVVLDESATGRPAALEVTYAGGAWSHADPAGAAPRRPAGELELSVRNAGGSALLVQVETAASDGGAATAARVTALQEFRDLFSSEVLAPGQEVGVSTVALLFSDLRGSTALYEGVGDAPAYGRVNRHFDFLREKIAAHEGGVVKTIGDAVMGAFASLEDALRAALEAQRDLAEWCRSQGIDPPFVLRVGVHHGPAIVVNANERLDYFGRTVNLAARVERESAGGDVVVLRELLDEPGARRALAGFQVSIELFDASLHGILETARLARLRLAPGAAGPGSGPTPGAAVPARPRT